MDDNKFLTMLAAAGLGEYKTVMDAQKSLTKDAETWRKFNEVLQALIVETYPTLPGAYVSIGNRGTRIAVSTRRMRQNGF